MKVISKTASLLSLGVLVGSVAFAASPEEAYLHTCRKEPGVPVPISVVSPMVGPEYAGTKVDVEFTVDQTGAPANLSVKSAADDELTSAVLEAVKQWKFKPAERNGSPVATKVVLPVKIVDPLTRETFAAN
jgi:protein TonB